MHDPSDAPADPLAFWEDFYLTKRTGTSGRPSAALVTYASNLAPGTSLDLGASHGDEVLWLAERGWQAFGVDISPTAVARATKRAAELGLSARAHFEVRDLARGLPEGRYDLVTALYLQSPLTFPRADILRQAAERVAPGGHLLVVAHAAPPPWAADMGKGVDFPTVAGELAAIGADPARWTTLMAGVVARSVTRPDGSTASLDDNVVMLRRDPPS